MTFKPRGMDHIRSSNQWGKAKRKIFSPKFVTNYSNHDFRRLFMGKFNFYSVIFLLIFYSQYLYAQKLIYTGTIQGKLSDADTKVPLIGANILVMNSALGAATDMEGHFIIENVPVGSYSLQFSYIGYETVTKTDIIVRSNRIIYVEQELRVSSLESEEVLVTAGYFQQKDEQPLCIINFSREEIRRAPGSAGDVSRIIQTLPSIAKINDQSNNLVVRGGNPIENTFFIDNIEVPNINHFPSQGSSGGPIGILNVDFIEDVNFYTGGFPSLYGDKLSSIMDLKFREGNRRQFDGQLDINFAGFGGVIEGPLGRGNGSYLFSARRSYLDFLIDKIDVGSTIAPTYGDIQGKVVYDVNQNHQLMLLGLFADDRMTSDQENAISNKMVFYADQNIYQYTTGVNWRALWHKSGYSNTSLAFTSSIFDEDIFETGSAEQIKQNKSHENSFHLRNVNHFRLNKQNFIEFGVEAKHLTGDFDNWYAEYTDAFGNIVPSLVIDKKITLKKIGAFISYISKPFERFTGTFGIRTDYASHNERVNISPRVSLSYQIANRTSLNASTGIFYQNLPLLLLGANEKNKELKDPSAVHYIVGVRHMLTASTRLTLEFYRKDYSHFPIDPNQPGLFLLDELLYRDAFFFSNENLIATGKAKSWGVELMVQKKLAKDFYGLVGGAYFRTAYKGTDEIWRNRIYDNQFLFSTEGGYKPSNEWEFSVRWVYAGGRPYTPFDIEASQALNRSVLDENRINGDRYTAYHSLNLRFDRRFHFSKSNLVLYFSVWNVYNRQNVATYFWNQSENKPDVIYQWGVLPIFGLEFEF